VFVSIIEVGFAFGSSSMAIKSMSTDIKVLKFTMIMLVVSSNSKFRHLSSIMCFNQDRVADLVN
jgi:hypothetical protein